jgi:16S rRNA (adenine1518-N6/adenine1519-N6)-dimethyltransferase
VRILSDVDIRALLRKYGVKYDKRRGQSFLKSNYVAREIVRLAEIDSDDRVLEIGGGLGILTEWLAEKAKSVCVVEIEQGLVEALQDRFIESKNVTVIEGDALVVDLPAVDKVVSNLPYSISSEITFRILREVDFQSALLMYQKEFAERLVAKPGSQAYSRLSVNFQYRAQAEEVMDVDSSMFYPEPSVDSKVVRITHRKSGPFAMDDFVFEWMIRGIYSYPNKQLRRAMRIWFKNLGVSRNLADDVIKDCGIDGLETMRLRRLDLETLVILADVLKDFVEDERLPGPEGSQSEG